MGRTCLLVSCLVAVSLSSAIAQPLAVLTFQITRNNTVVARPVLMLASGGEGRIDLVVDDRQSVVNPLLKGMRESIKVTPTFRRDDLAVAFDVTTGGKANELATRRCDDPIDPLEACEQFRSTLLISRAAPGVVEWTSPSAGPIRLTVSWVE